MKFELLAVLLLGISLGLSAQDSHTYLRAGDKAYINQDFDEARRYYEGAAREKRSAQALYNKGNALYQMGEYEEAAKHFQESLDLSNQNDLRFKNYHNQGNAYMRTKNYEKAVESYKNALKIHPDDWGTKENLVRALKKLSPPQQKQQKQQKEENEEKKDKQEQDQQNQKKNESPQQKEEKAGDDQNPPPKELTEEEADRLLKAVEQEDQSVQKKVKKKKEDDQARPTKDW